jgi:hypothetical protein
MIQENFTGKGDVQHKLKGLETLDSKVEVEGPSKSPTESPPPSPKEDQPQPPDREIELCTPDIVDLPIINL